MLGIAIPAHDEEQFISAAVHAAWRAARHPALTGEAVRVVVVADACSDATAALAHEAGAQVLHSAARNVGRARAQAADALLAAGARWLAFTDADSRVADDWLVQQLQLAADAVCGCVEVDDWLHHGGAAQAVREQFHLRYRPREGHRHVHGANLGVSAAAYVRAGGFAPLACSEDVALVEALEATGARIAWSTRPRVHTSARRHARATGGFADTLWRQWMQPQAAGAGAAAGLLALPAPVGV